jgi:hypothetical protein
MSRSYLANNSGKTKEYFIEEKENKIFYNKVKDLFLYEKLPIYFGQPAVEAFI